MAHASRNCSRAHRIFGQATYFFFFSSSRWIWRISVFFFLIFGVNVRSLRSLFLPPLPLPPSQIECECACTVVNRNDGYTYTYYMTIVVCVRALKPDNTHWQSEQICHKHKYTIWCGDGWRCQWQIRAYTHTHTKSLKMKTQIDIRKEHDRK